MGSKISDEDCECIFGVECESQIGKEEEEEEEEGELQWCVCRKIHSHETGTSVFNQLYSLSCWDLQGLN